MNIDIQLLKPLTENAHDLPMYCSTPLLSLDVFFPIHKYKTECFCKCMKLLKRTKMYLNRSGALL